MSSSSSKKPSSQAQIDELLKRLSAQDERITALETVPSAPAEKKPRKKRAPKNPDAPKKPRALTAFFLFNAAERAKTTDKITTPELAKRWRALTDEERASYKPAAAATATAAAATNPTFQEARAVAATMTSSVASKFLRFCVQNPTLDAKTAEVRWKALSPEEKAKFNDPGDDTDDASSVDSDSD
jgi:hypothetical protein